MKREKSFKKSSTGFKSQFKFIRKVLKFAPIDCRSFAPQATCVTFKEALLTEILKTFDRRAASIFGHMDESDAWGSPQRQMQRSKSEITDKYGYDYIDKRK
jgi:hypothetical protein